MYLKGESHEASTAGSHSLARSPYRILGSKCNPKFFSPFLDWPKHLILNYHGGSQFEARWKQNESMQVENMAGEESGRKTESKME